MAPMIEELSGCVTEWRVILLSEGLELNPAKSKVMVGIRAVMRYYEVLLARA